MKSPSATIFKSQPPIWPSRFSSIQSINNTKLLAKPILIKISPDLSYNELDSIIELVKKYRISGIVATNSTNKRENLKTKENLVRKIGAGGLTGRPIKNKSTDVIKYIHQKSLGTIPIIGVGGINSVEDAIEKIDAGATLIQLYTGFIYQGPLLVKKINQEILKRYR